MTSLTAEGQTIHSSQSEAERLASSLPPLLLAAERVAETVIQGLHGIRRAGSGDAFWQFRRYQPGDMPRRIDWRKSGKSEHIYVRETEWMTAETVYLWCDASPSMRYRSQEGLPSKRERGLILTLALAAMLLRGEERIAALGAGTPPLTSRASLNRFALQLLQGGDDSLPPHRLLPAHARVILISDFLSPLEAIQASLKAYAAHNVRGYLIQLADPAEEELPFSGRVRFEGLEAEGDLLISRSETVRDAYIARYHQHQQAIRDLCRQLRFRHMALRTDQPPYTSVLMLYRHLTESGGYRL